MKLKKKLDSKAEVKDPEAPEAIKPAGDKKKPKKNLQSLFSYSGFGVALGLVLSVSLTLGVAYHFYQTQIVDVRESQLAEYSRQKAQLTSNNVATYFESTSQEIQFYLNKKILKTAILEDDKAQFDLYKESIKKQVDGVVAVRFFRDGVAQLEPDSFPPVRFTELELIRRVQGGQPVFPEGAKVDKQWLVNYVLPITAQVESEPPIGVFIVTTDSSVLSQLLRENNDSLGQVVLAQSFDGSTKTTVLRAGMGSYGDMVESPVGTSHWLIQFTPSIQLFARTHANTTQVVALISAIFVGLLVLFVGLGFVVGRNLDQRRQEKLIMQNVMGVGASGDAIDEAYLNPIYQTKSIIDVDVEKADEALLGFDDDDSESEEAEEVLSLDDDVFDMDDEGLESTLPAAVFRAYDIRGIAGEQIDKEFALKLGQVLGSEAIDNREDTLIVARDARTHSPELTEYLVRGILSSGCNVLNIGTVPTPLLYFSTETLDESSSGVMVTASHNPAEYNGFKIVMNGKSRSGEDIKALKQRIDKKEFYQGQGQEHRHDIVADYIDTIFSDVALAGEVSIVIDAANAVPGKVAPQLFDELGCQVTPLYCDLDGSFPNHNPDPSVEDNLKDLIEKVKDTNADLGVAFDGDGDRLAVVTPKGKIIWADRLLMLFAKDIISRNPGADVVFDVKSTRHLNSCVTSYGGRPIMWKTGHSLMKQKMLDSGALVGAEYSGHIFIKDRWFGFDDGMYAAARLIEIMSLQGEDLDTIMEEFPESLSTPEIRIAVGDEEKFELIEKLSAEGDFGEGRVTKLDGLRADYAYGWGLVRASNTGAEITLRFEADTEDAMHQLKSLFIRELRKIDSSINVNWDQ